MDWRKLFATHILERGYNYYCENAVEDLDISIDTIRANVIGTEDYEVEISLNNGEVADMYCSCPYADDGGNCKHMAAVLFEWSEGKRQSENVNEQSDADENLFIAAHTIEAYKKKMNAIAELVEKADVELVRSYLTSVLAENKKLLVRFNSIVKERIAEEDMKHYINQVDDIANRYLGRNHFISYYEAGGFISELEDIIDVDVRRMIDNENYMGAFELMNYIFALIGDVDMDDSDGGTGMLADRIYQLWVELLAKVDADEKLQMFRWFTTHLDGSIIDYLEEYIEKILIEEFDEKEYEQEKLIFIENMLNKSASKDSDWTREYHIGKWAIRYLDIMEKQGGSKEQVEQFCNKYWENSSVRRYYIDMCMHAKEYDRALNVLNESMVLDKEYRGLVSEYSKKKKEIFSLQGNTKAYIGQLWELMLNHDAGNLDVYRELKKQYTAKEWLEKREEIFEKLPQYAHVERLYKEEKLYDRLLGYVMASPGLHGVQEYESILICKTAF